MQSLLVWCFARTRACHDEYRRLDKQCACAKPQRSTPVKQQAFDWVATCDCHQTAFSGTIAQVRGKWHQVHRRTTQWMQTICINKFHNLSYATCFSQQSARKLLASSQICALNTLSICSALLFALPIKVRNSHSSETSKLAFCKSLFGLLLAANCRKELISASDKICAPVKCISSDRAFFGSKQNLRNKQKALRNKATKKSLLFERVNRSNTACICICFWLANRRSINICIIVFKQATRKEY